MEGKYHKHSYNLNTEVGTCSSVPLCVSIEVCTFSQRTSNMLGWSPLTSLSAAPLALEGIVKQRIPLDLGAGFFAPWLHYYTSPTPLFAH